MSTTPPIEWKFSRFDSLSPQEVHDFLAARQDVFIVEQTCIFQDIDGHDPGCWHLLGYGTVDKAADGEGRSQLAAYSRIVPPGVIFAQSSIGRIITTTKFRGRNIGRELMRQSIESCQSTFPGPIRIAAQIHLEKFYDEFGFTRASDPYDEDGIEHIEMLRAESA